MDEVSDLSSEYEDNELDEEYDEDNELDEEYDEDNEVPLMVRLTRTITLKNPTAASNFVGGYDAKLIRRD